MKEHRVSGQRWLSAFIAAQLFLSQYAMANPETFRLGDETIKPGSRAQLSLDVPAGASDPATLIPVTVIHGQAPGPVLLIVAGVHGYEFASILAAHTFSAEVEAARLSGTLLIVNVAHVSAFEDRTPYVNPYDRKNLNRSFPGDANGTQTERIAWVLSKQLIARADFVIDAHSGDGAEWLEAFVGVYGGPLATGFEQALAVGEAFAFPNVVRYRMESQEQIDRGRSLNRQAVAAGVPTVLVEIGQNGSREPSHVRALADGLHRTLSVLSMSSSSPETPPVTLRYFEGESSVPVKHSGVWSPTRTGGRPVTKGELLGTIQDYWGHTIEEVVAPVDGYALYGLAGPPIKRGESVMAITRPAERLEKPR
ncbi:MAG: succinylglutamate desuccinylase/aspartoacylase family protein [Pseudomonadota bacterium]